MKMERVRFVLPKPNRKRMEKYYVSLGQCKGFVHHHFRVTHPDWKKYGTMYTSPKREIEGTESKKDSFRIRRFGNLEKEEEKS